MLRKTLFGLASLAAVTACQTTVSGPSPDNDVASQATIYSNEAARAICASTPVSFDWAASSSDQRLTAEALSSRVAGKRLEFSYGASETYAPDGSYAYREGDQIYSAPGYALYPDGSRCIAYPSPRYDLYVLEGRTLVLINQSGERYPLGE